MPKSPENQTARKRNRNIPEWKVGEFLWEFLEGTKTKPDYITEDVDLDELEEEDVTDTADSEDKDEAADDVSNIDN